MSSLERSDLYVGRSVQYIAVRLLIAAGAYCFFRVCFIFKGTQEGYAVFLKKSSKIQDSKNASSAAQAFAQQSGLNHGLNLDALLRTHKPALQHQANAPSAHRPPLFYPLSPGSSFAVGKTNMS